MGSSYTLQFSAVRFTTSGVTMNKKTKPGAVKSFIGDFVRKKTKAEQLQSEPSLKLFIVELLIFASLVLGYFFLVLIFLANWLKTLFDASKPLYALVALALIVTQGVVLEVISAVVLKLVESKLE